MKITTGTDKVPLIYLPSNRFWIFVVNLKDRPKETEDEA
jgi:hypothetical protein